MKKSNLEVRYITSEIRALESESRKIGGLAIPSESRSELLRTRDGDFYETISRDALTEDLIKTMDIKLYLNHDMSQGTFARSKFGKGSLRLFITERGLEFETELPNTVFGDMLLEGIRRGDYDALSFAFIPGQMKWKDNKDGTWDRTINSIDVIDEISLLSVAPAYEATEVSCRSLENYKEELRQAEEEKKKQILESLDTKMKEFEDAAQLDK
jgi:HK97 family phage prohead protease